MEPIKLSHFRHEHPLVIFVSITFIKDALSARPQSCSQCNWSLCIDCFSLPKHLDHNFYFHSHVDHPNLSLSISPNSPEFTCSLCHHSFDLSTPRFLCTKCGFVVDVECALAPPIKHHEGPAYFQHFTHPQHPMILVDRKDVYGGDDDDNEYRCFACDLPCKPGQSYLSCINCKYLLHKSCAELPLKIRLDPFVGYGFFSFVIQSPFVNQRPRRLDENFRCKFCNNCFSSRGFRFEHSAVSIQICGRCIFLRPSFKYEGHEHLLCLVEKEHGRRLECSAGYDNYCKLPVNSEELSSAESFFMYRCLVCEFNIHLLCGPLPCTIEDECHIHPLVLVDLLVENDSDEYYCDICEDKRDSKICVYYCQECKYTAHVHCVISTVMNTLRGDLRNVRLKTVKIHGDEKYEKHNKGFQGKEVAAMVFKDIMEKQTMKEQVTLLCDFDWDVLIEPPEEINETIQIGKLSRFSTDYLEKFIDSLNMEFNYSEAHRRRFSSLSKLRDFVTVEGYLIPRKVAGFLVRLFRRHGDISRNSKSTLVMKSFTFSFLCQVLNSMGKKKVGSVTEDDLKEWYFYANYAKRRGFDVEFMFPRLKDLVRVFFSRQAAAERKKFRTISLVGADNIRELQKEFNLFKSRSYEKISSSVDWVECLMECSSAALISWDKNCLDDLL
ncbi:hypothetical protein TIFTF001_008376 [Ficus carica]|uniref:DC1 domain-containing protein n=1 Tax=Ficus carica TaxID=3494 RepID=A0AA88D1N8_FICCA|nr:hypothetical protein TIFTF001_008376 [Ficus carica]